MVSLEYRTGLPYAIIETSDDKILIKTSTAIRISLSQLSQMRFTNNTMAMIAADLNINGNGAPVS